MLACFLTDSHEFIVYRCCLSFIELLTSLSFCFCFRMTFLPALQFAREQGLSITLHCGEVGSAFLKLLPFSIYVLSY